MKYIHSSESLTIPEGGEYTSAPRASPIQKTAPANERRDSQ